LRWYFIVKIRSGLRWYFIVKIRSGLRWYFIVKMDRRNVGCRRWMKLARVCVQWRTTNVSCLFNADFTCSDCMSSVTVRTVQNEMALSLKLSRATEEKQQNSVTVIDMSNKIRNQYLRAKGSTSHGWFT